MERKNKGKRKRDLSQSDSEDERRFHRSKDDRVKNDRTRDFSDNSDDETEPDYVFEDDTARISICMYIRKMTIITQTILVIMNFLTKREIGTIVCYDM